MKLLLTSIVLLCTFSFLGCAPSQSSAPATTEIQLPSRPSSNESIAARALLYKNDSRVSYCEILNNDSASYSGFRDLKLEPLASLSKLITSAWAIQVLGTDYRFKSEWYLRPVPGQPGQFDAYLRTNYDPVVNIEKLLYFLSELHTLGVKGLRQLTIDETTRVYLAILTQPHAELSITPVASSETAENLMLIFNSKNWAARTTKARDVLMGWAAKNNKSVIVPSSFSVEQVLIKNSSDINVQSYSIHKTITSAPLFKYLKNMNVNSNNYMADAIFNSLGGTEKFANFQKNQLKLTQKEMQIFTGSGLAETIQGERQDNLGTCFGMMTVLSYLRQLTVKVQLNLGYILLNPTADKDGTFETNSEYQNSVVLKTGRLFENPALNLAGFVATEKGTLTFVFLGHDFTVNEAKNIESIRSEMLDHIYDHYPTTSSYKTLNEYEIFF